MAGSKHIFEHVLNGFEVPLSVINHWVSVCKKAETWGNDDYSGKNDPVATWANGADITVDALLEKCHKMGYESRSGHGNEYAESDFQYLMNHLDSIINEIVKEQEKKPGDIIIFGRDCWPLSLRMVHRGIKHYYVEGASRSIMYDMTFKDMFTGLIPKPENAILVDTGYVGSVPENFCRAYGMTNLATEEIPFDTDCRIMLIHSHKWKSRQIKWCEGECPSGSTYNYACFVEYIPKFFGRPQKPNSKGFPELQIAQQAVGAAIIYCMMVKYAEKEKEKQEKKAA